MSAVTGPPTISLAGCVMLLEAARGECHDQTVPPTISLAGCVMSLEAALGECRDRTTHRQSTRPCNVTGGCSR